MNEVCALSDAGESNEEDATEITAASCRRSPLDLAGGAQQIDRKQCPFRRFLMLEVSEDIATGSQVFSDPRDHCTAFFFRVTRLAKSVIDKRSSHHIRSGAFFGLRHAERDSLRFQ